MVGVVVVVVIAVRIVCAYVRIVKIPGRPWVGEWAVAGGVGSNS